MRENIASRLFDIVSLEIQERYIINPTKDEYLLPEEIVDILYHGCRYLINENDFSREEILMSKKIIDCIDKLNWEEINKNSMESLIYYNEDWIKLRNTALEFLNLLGYSLNDFDKDGNLT